MVSSEILKTNVEYIKIAGWIGYQQLRQRRAHNDARRCRSSGPLGTRCPRIQKYSSQTASSRQPNRLVHAPWQFAAFDSYEHFTQYSDEILDLLGDMTTRRSSTRRCWRW
ncbi:uncharacterized protein LOC119770575 isoform X1 [Culex quinquefasciatus]|uniref:uncharacterized protein LOC119770575 isoform X1 n=1 Tax=Culex quinquefasciatus TaxID=7176 RepID=UPI0018E3F4BD|nr:uncharacterized protein LOC119770575 isoform X1 [Culex quinquefasciatus]XP_038121647.1 uncharacterized protein LOC119770575 isoform X1 [Culex quinquefasciatus]